jgi:MoaA/NifB/PqqE/SkfB family radical SAM enzyme
VQNNIFLTISIDSIIKEIYEKIRVGGKFEKLLNILEKIKGYRGSFKNSSFVLQMAIVVMKINYREIKSMVDFAISYGFNEIIFHKYSSCGEETDKKLKLDEEENDIVLDEINSLRDNIEINKKIKIITSIGYLKNNINIMENEKNLKSPEKKEELNIDLSCLAPWKSLYIGEDMNVMPACHCRTFRDKDLFDDGKFWNGTIMQKFRKSIINNNLLEHCMKVCFNSGDVGKFLRGL